MLSDLLLALERQRLPDWLACEVMVIDNDPDGSAQPVVDLARQRGRMKISHTLEPQPGIAAARNRALQVARGHAIAFVDDDEVPGEEWLARLVDTLHRFEADIVFAPVTPDYGPDTAQWIKACGIFERRRLVTGQVVGRTDMRSGNVLISLPWLKRQRPALAFDNRLGLTGGEDALFFSQAADRGARAVWCDDAPVTEVVPPSRATASYLLRRYFQIGISSCTIERIRCGQMGRLRELLKGLLLLPVGLVVGTVSLPWSHRTAARWYTKAVCGAGKVAGAFGHQYEIYATVPAAR
jgi:succinoglycan biosynthesis protein ExoM